MKNLFHVTSKLIAVLLLVIMVAGCASTTQHAVEISNVLDIKELNIRNAGSANWGTNNVKNMDNIDKSHFSENVDIRVIDSNGVVYSKYNVPFSNAAFVETGVTHPMNIFGQLGLLAVLIGGIYGLYKIMPASGGY